MFSHKTSDMYECYIGYAQDESIRVGSSSGGFFYSIAKQIISRGGVVYGAAFTNDSIVNHIRVDNENNLSFIMTSKYVQSSMCSIYRHIAEDLLDGKIVLFSGTPCQVAAVDKYLKLKKISSDKLVLIDFICHGVPSPGIWKSYVHYIEKRHSPIITANFRNKAFGWHDYCMQFIFADYKRYCVSHEKDPYMRTFLSDKNIRPSCFNCHQKGEKYSSDITMGDAWKVEKEKKEWSDDKGTSLLVVRTSKGEKLLSSISGDFIYEKVNYNTWVRLNPSLVSSTVENPGRKQFFLDYIQSDNVSFWNKNQYISSRIKIKYCAKRILKIVGIERLVRQYWR